MHMRSRATGSARTVGIVFGFYAEPVTTLAWPKDETLLVEWGLSEPTVRRGLRVLERLGELRRRPDLETHRRRRVFEVGASQLSILEPVPLTPVRRPSDARHLARAADMPLIGEVNVVTSNARERASGIQLQSGEITGSLPRIPLTQRSAAAARRDRRRGRGARRSASSGPLLVAPEPCPTLSGGDEGGGMLERWDEVQARLRELLGDSWSIWGDGAHPHRADEQLLVVGLTPVRATWCRDRQHQLGRALGLSIEFVGCESLLVASASC